MRILTKATLISASALLFISCARAQYNTDNNEIIKTSKRTVTFLTDSSGMSLYTFDKDTLNKSNCKVGKCQSIWPLFKSLDTKANLKEVNPSNGHIAYKKHPLYYFVKDSKIEDIKGNNKKNVWHLVHDSGIVKNNAIKLSTKKIEQTYLTDKNGRTLYTFDKDTKNKSNCYGKCETLWPVFYSDNLGTLPTGIKSEDFATVTRDKNKTKGSQKQLAYKGKPLYYFIADKKKSGVVNGDWKKGVWHVVELNSK